MSRSEGLSGIVVGAGYFADYHLEAWHRIPGVHIAAVLDRDPARARAAATRHGVPRGDDVALLSALGEEIRPDFVDLVTPPPRFDLLAAAAPTARCIISQKPLAADLAGAAAFLAAARSSGVRLVVHENWRWQPWYREIHRQLVGGRIGQVLSCAYHIRLGDGWQPDAYLDRQPFFRTLPRLLVHETLVHHLDTLRYLVGEVVAVSARLRRCHPGIVGEDCAHLLLGFETGATGLIDASRYHQSDAPDPRLTFGTLRIDGDAGHLELGAEGQIRLRRLGQPAETVAYPWVRRGFGGDSVHAFQSQVAASLRGDAPWEREAEDYLRTLAIVEACYAAHATGTVQSPGRLTPSPCHP